MIKDKIGTNAGKIWQLIYTEGEYTVKQLKEELKLADDELYLSLGWLAREDKIFINKTKNDTWITMLYD